MLTLIKKTISFHEEIIVTKITTYSICLSEINYFILWAWKKFCPFSVKSGNPIYGIFAFNITQILWFSVTN